MSPTASTAIYLHGDEPLKVTLNTSRPESPFASIDLSDDGRTYLVVHGTAEADALILAAVAAKDLLLGAQERPLFHLSRADLATLANSGDSAALAEWQARERGSAEPAPLPPGHGENHHDNAGHAYGVTAGETLGGLPCPCGPGRCTCGATVSAAGGVTPAEPVQVST